MKRLAELLNPLLARFRTEVADRFAAELAGSDRAKALVATVGLVLLVSVVIALASTADRLAREYRASAVAYGRLQAQANATAWSERRTQSQALKLALEERFWIANTPGLAEAGFERWLREHLARYKVEPQTIQVRRVAVATGNDAVGNRSLAGMERMTAKVLMQFDDTALTGILADIAESERALVIDRLIVRAGRNARIEMDVTAFYPSRDKGP